MKNKTSTKLNHILNAVPMIQEHKNMLLEVFNEVSNESIIELYPESNKVVFDNIEYNCSMEHNIINDFITFTITNKELHDILMNDIISNKFINKAKISYEYIMYCNIMNQGYDYENSSVTFMIFIDNSVKINIKA